MAVVGDVQRRAVGRHELDADQVVAPEAVLGHQPAEPAAERVAGNPGRRDRASGHGEAVCVRLAIELTPRHAALGAQRACLRVDVDPRHLRQVDHQSSVRHRSAGDVVAAAANGDPEAARPRERESIHDVRRPAAARDDGGPTVDQAVVDPPGVVVAVVSGQSHPSGERRGERLEQLDVDGRGRHSGLPSSDSPRPVSHPAPRRSGRSRCGSRKKR